MALTFSFYGHDQNLEAPRLKFWQVHILFTALKLNKSFLMNVLYFKQNLIIPFEDFKVWKFAVEKKKVELMTHICHVAPMSVTLNFFRPKVKKTSSSSLISSYIFFYVKAKMLYYISSFKQTVVVFVMFSCSIILAQFKNQKVLHSASFYIKVLKLM
jgi:hypothetical protein